MTLEERISYWRGRASLAKRLGLQKEAEVAGQIVSELAAARSAVNRADTRVDRLIEQMPDELYEQE
jgi:hypothetical protein